MTTVIAVVLLLMLFLAIIHFVYESILLPSIRLRLRFRMFALRDDLRSLACEKTDELDSKVYEQMQDSINTALAFLYRIDVRSIYEVAQLLKSDTSLKERAGKRAHEIENYPMEELQNIRRKCLTVFALALFANSAIFFLYLGIPLILIAFIMFIFNRLNEVVAKLNIIFKSVICAPEKEIERKLHSYRGLT